MTIDYLLIGTITADITPQGRKLGGTVSYCGRVAQAFGQSVTVVTSAADNDPLLDELRSYVSVVNLPAKETTTFENIYTPTGRIQYVRAVGGKITREHIKQLRLTSPLIHLAPLADEVDPELVFDFPDSIVMLTPQGWMRRWESDGRVHFKRWMDKNVLKAATLVVFSKEDIENSSTIEAEFAQVGKHVIVTEGEKGGIYYYNGEPKRFSALKIEEKDLTGAGDVYAASLLSVLPRLNNNIFAAVQTAAWLASLSVQRVGMDKAPKSDEIEWGLREAQTLLK